MFIQKFSKALIPSARLAAVKQVSLVASQQRLFSSVEMVARSGAKLVKALDKEMKYENDNYNQLEDIDTFIRESGWGYSEVQDGIMMMLSKTVGDKKIEVVFEARQPQADEEGQQEEGQEQEEEQGMSENYCDFTIIISDVQGNTGLIVEATTMDTEVNYNSVMATDDLKHSRNYCDFTIIISDVQ